MAGGWGQWSWQKLGVWNVCVCVCVCVHAHNQSRLSSGLKGYVFNYLLDSSTWMSQRHFRFVMFKTELLISPQHKIMTLIAYSEWCQIRDLWRRRFSFGTRNQAWSLRAFVWQRFYCDTDIRRETESAPLLVFSRPYILSPYPLLQHTS